MQEMCHNRTTTLHVVSIQCMYSHTTKKIWDNFCLLKIRGLTYMRVTVGQHMCHKFFHRQMMSAELRLKDTLPRSAAIGRRGSLACHVGLRNLTLLLQQGEWAAREEYTAAFCATLSPGRSPTWAWLADDWHHKWRIIVALLDAAARRRVAPCCDQLLSSLQKYVDFSHCCIALDAVNGISHVTYRMVYKVYKVNLYAGLEFWTFFDQRRRVDLYADWLVRTYIQQSQSFQQFDLHC